jgi:hypothetical protein
MAERLEEAGQAAKVNIEVRDTGRVKVNWTSKSRSSNWPPLAWPQTAATSTADSPLPAATSCTPAADSSAG